MADTVEDLFPSAGAPTPAAPATPAMTPAAAPRLGPTQRMWTPDNKPIDVPIGDVADIVRRGEAGFGNDQPVIIAGIDGKQRTVSGRDAAHLLTSSAGLGTRVITRGEAEAQITKDAYESTLGTAHSALAGVARGATLGGSDALLSTDETQRQALANSQQINPGVSLAGEGVGVLASAIPTGGEGLLGRGLQGAAELSRAGKAIEGATLIPRAVNAIGHGVEGGILTGADAIGLAREGLTAKTLAATGRTAVEGGIYGLGNAVSDSAINNKPLTSELLLADATHGAVLGALGGGGLSLLGGAGRAIAKKGADTITGLFERATPEFDQIGTKGLGQAVEAGAAPAMTDKTIEGYIKTVAKTEEEAAGLREAWKRRGELGKSDDVLQGAERKLRGNVDQLLEAETEMTPEAMGKLKREHVARAVRTGNEDSTLAYTGEATQKIRDELDRMEAAGYGVYGQVANIKKARAVLDHVEGQIQKAVGTGEQNAEAFVELDYLKRRFGKFAKPGQFLGADSATAQSFREMYEGLRVGLEDKDLWGKAATQQEANNAIWSKQLTSKGLFNNRFTTELGEKLEGDPWRNKVGVDSAKVASYVNGFGRAANDLNHETLASHVKNTRELVQTIGDQYEVKPGVIEKANKAVADFEGTLKGVESEVGAVNRLNRLKEAEGHGFGGALGVATDIALRPMESLARVAQVEAVVNRVQNRIGGSIKAFLEGAKGVAGRSLPRLPVGAGAAAIDARAAKKDDSPKDFEEHRAAIATYLANPHPANEAATRGLPEGLATQMAQDAISKAQYLASKLPQQAPRNPLMPHLPPRPESPAQRDKWMRIARAVNSPLTVIDDLRDGKLTREAAEALRATSPLIFSQVQKQVLGALQGAEKQPSYAKRLQLGMFLDIPSDSSLVPANLAAMQASFDPEPQSNGGAPAPSHRKPIDLSGDFQTKSQSEVHP